MKILTFGEIMLRLKTPEHLRIVQADGFEASYGGAESNVAVSLATLGNDAAFLTKLPWAMPRSMSFAATVLIPPAFCGAAHGLASIFLKKEATSAPQVSSMTGPEAPWLRQRHQNLTGKRCSPALTSFSFPVSLRPSVLLRNRLFLMR